MKLRFPSWRFKSRAAAERLEPDVTDEGSEPVSEVSLVMVDAKQLARPFLLLVSLLVAIVISAVAVIFSAYEYRLLFHEHQQLIQQRDDYQVEWGQLLLEQSAWAANNRVENQAREKLEMLVPEPDVIEVIRYGE